MAAVLDERGVYQQALEYVKEALASKPDDPQALFTEATIFSHLERYTECVSAAQAAINQSDGKYAWMHFRARQLLFFTGKLEQGCHQLPFGGCCR